MDAFFGITPAVNTSVNGGPGSIPSNALSSHEHPLLHPSLPGEFVLYVDESNDVVVISCEVSLPSKEHSVHLLCPLVPETRLCFENCRRVCSLPDCTDQPKLFTVECVEDLFVRDMFNIWKFRYIINRHDPAIEGTWSCFHAGKTTEMVNITAVLSTATITTMEPPKQPSTRISDVGEIIPPWLGFYSDRLNLRESALLKPSRNNASSIIKRSKL